MTDDNMRKPITDLGQAGNFLHETFYHAGFNLNPELGFLKPNNESAFSGVSDILAQRAQQRLGECIDLFKQENIDIWEVCMELSIYVTTKDYCEAVFPEGHLLHSAQWLEYLNKRHETGMNVNAVRIPLGEESEGNREERRSHFVINTIQQMHAEHPYVASTIPQTWQVGTGKQAAFFCTALLPVGWVEVLDAASKHIGGFKLGDLTYDADISAQEVEDIMQSKVDEINRNHGDADDPDDDDNDDDPLKGNW